MIRLGCSALLICFFSAWATATEFYRYKDDNGNLVINSSISPDMVDRGYDVINEKGTVLRKVDPKLTGEELEKRKLELQRQQEEETAEKAQEIYDLNLLRKYSFVTDIEAEQKRQVGQLNVRLSILKGNLNGLRAELEAEYAAAAKLERQDKAVDKKLLKRIEHLENQVSITEQLLIKRQNAIAEVEKEYAKAIERFKELEVLRGRR